jgi:hypothetical protein
MKKLFLVMLFAYSIQHISAQNANRNLSNLLSPTAANVDLLPVSDNSINIGSLNRSWKDAYFNGAVYMGGFRFLAYTTGTGAQNTATGLAALNSNTTGSRNTGTGFNALLFNIDGSGNTANGSKALYSNTTGNNNVAVGTRAMIENTTGYSNIAIGIDALSKNTVRSNLVAIGDSALYNSNPDLSEDFLGIENTAIGSKTLYMSINGSYNTACGYEALTSTDGYYNTAIGVSSLHSDSSGYDNTAVGGLSLYKNVLGQSNTAIAMQALHENISGSNNIAVGEDALYSNTSGSSNTAIGGPSLYHNITGNSNIAFGANALQFNTFGSSNIAIGERALFGNDKISGLIAVGDSALYNCYGGISNTAIGSRALLQLTTGSANTVLGISAGSALTKQSNNTIVGAFTGNEFTTTNATLIGYDNDPNAGGYANITALGYKTQNTASNQVRIGNASVTSIGGHVNWSVFSDGRYKKNVKENVVGLAFINKLTPVTYTLDINGINARAYHSLEQSALSEEDKKAIQEKEKIIYSGFIAQDVEKTAKQIGYDFSGIDAPKNDNDLYGLRYSDFVVPLVKAVQELSKMNDSLKNENETQQTEIDELRTMMLQFQQKLNSCSPCGQITTQSNQQSITGINNASLQQNIPNPFDHTTTIGYSLPNQFSSAQIIITDKNGRQLKHINLSSAGKGTITVDALTLASGAYNYSLYIDGRFTASKQMVLAK